MKMQKSCIWTRHETVHEITVSFMRYEKSFFATGKLDYHEVASACSALPTSWTVRYHFFCISLFQKVTWSWLQGWGRDLKLRYVNRMSLLLFFSFIFYIFTHLFYTTQLLSLHKCHISLLRDRNKSTYLLPDQLWKELWVFLFALIHQPQHQYRIYKTTNQQGT